LVSDDSPAAKICTKKCISYIATALYLQKYKFQSTFAKAFSQNPKSFVHLLFEDEYEVEDH